jgi:hypothetical protein
MGEAEEKFDRYGEDSEFNAGIATLRRLDEIKKHLDNDTETKNYEGKFLHLNAFFNELHSMMSKEKRIKTNDVPMSEKEMQEKTFIMMGEKIEQFERRTITDKEISKLLNDWELELRDIEQEHNLNMPMGKDKRWSLGTGKR